ncbi:serine/threonine protein kinase [Streptomyces ginkgonis]|uniref:serine/threonine protein kinase n=1 Tax=Streptomyces ginkgonis TaxID=1812259 RepID=UPI0021769FAF|nr:serine/threonine protein kinase [Streptomyces ginkgonis]
METYAGRLLADRYRLPRTPSEAFELVESRAFDTASGQEVLVRQVPLPEVVDAEVVDEDGGRARPVGARRGVGDRATRSPEDPVVRRALEAAAAAGQLPDHPRLDQVFDVFVQGDGLWIVSELVPARPLAAVLAEARLGPYRAAEVAADLLAALRIVHAHGWTHRNVTTRTVLICEDGRALLTGLASGAAEEVLCGYDPLPAPAAPDRQSLPPGGGGQAPGTGEAWGVPRQGQAAPAAGAPWSSDGNAPSAEDRYRRWPSPGGEGAPGVSGVPGTPAAGQEWHGDPADGAGQEPYGAPDRDGRDAYGGAASHGGAGYGGPEAPDGPQPYGGHGQGHDGTGGYGAATGHDHGHGHGHDHDGAGALAPSAPSAPHGQGAPPAAGGHGPMGAAAERWDADPADGAGAGVTDRYRRWGGGGPQGPATQGFPAAWDFEGGGGARLSAEERAARSGAIAAYRAGTQAGANAAGTAGGPGAGTTPSPAAGTGTGAGPAPVSGAAAGGASGPAALPAPGRESRAVRTGWDPPPAPRAAVQTSATPRYRGPDTALAAERARQARIMTVGAVTERWAPEQAGPVHDHWQLAPPVGPPADFWALGALLFRAVQGHPPYPEENPAELVQAVCAEPPAFAEECGALRPIVESLLRQDPTERPSAEELRGWLRSLLRSAPEPEVGRRTVTTPLPALEPGRPSDPRRLPIARRRGELVGPRRRGRGGGHHPRRLGKLLLTLTLLGLAGSIAYIVLFLAEDPQDRAGQPPVSSEPSTEPTPDPPDPSGDASGGADDADGADDGGREPTPDGQGGRGLPQGYVVLEDPAGFSMSLPEDWSRTTTSDGAVVFSDGEVEIVVVPGRDGTDQYAQGPMAYQMDHLGELEGFRADTYATSSGLRETRVGASVMAQGNFRWRADGSEWIAHNQVMQLGDRYHVVLVRGPVGAGDTVAEVFDAVADSYRY